jgi:hypothetical protein
MDAVKVNMVVVLEGMFYFYFIWWDVGLFRILKRRQSFKFPWCISIKGRVLAGL